MPVVQYIGSDPTWGPQQQVARRHLQEQTSVTLGDLSQSDSNIRDRSRDAANNPYQLRWRDSTYAIIQAATQWALNRLDTTVLGVADYDPTVRGVLKGGDPYQLRWRDSTTSNISGATQEWTRKRFSTNELGVADRDPTVKPNYQDPHQRRHADPAYAVLPTYAWARLRLTTNDLGDASQSDGTIKPPWAAGEAFYWPAPRQPGQVTSTNAWSRLRLTTNDLGLADQDTSIRPVYQDPHQRRHGDPAWYVQPTLAWMRLRLTTNDLGLADADPTVRPNWQMANPYTLRLGLSAIPAIEAWYQQLHLWEASTPSDAPVVNADPTVHPLWQAANPYTLRQGLSALPAIEAWYAQFHLWEASTPTDAAAPPDADPTLVRRTFVEPYQLRFRPSWPTQRRPWPTPLEEADPTVRQPWQYANPWHLRTRPSWPTQRLYYPQPGAPPAFVVDPDAKTITLYTRGATFTINTESHTVTLSGWGHRLTLNDEGHTGTSRGWNTDTEQE